MDSSYSMSVATIATLDVATALDKSGVNFDFSAHDVSFEQIELELEKIRKEAQLDTKSSNDEKLELSDDQPEELNQVLTDQFQSQLEREIVKETDEESQISIPEVDQQQIPQTQVEETSKAKQKSNLKASQPIEESKIIRYEYSFPSEASDIKKNMEYEEIAEESEDDQESFINQQNLELLGNNSFETISEVEVIQEVQIKPPKKGKYIGVALVHQLLNSKKNSPFTRI